MKVNILSLDLGRSSLGVALSRTGMFISPLENIHFQRDNYDEAINKLKDILMFEKIESIIIGLPTYPSGDPCEMTNVVEAFIPKLQIAFPKIEIIKIDERNSTLEASEVLHNNGKNSKKQKSNIDSIAASIILERYLKSIDQL